MPITRDAAYRQAVADAYNAQLGELLATMNAAQAAGYDPLRVVTMFTNGADCAGIRRQLSLTVPGYSNYTAEAKMDGWDQALATVAPPASAKD